MEIIRFILLAPWHPKHRKLYGEWVENFQNIKYNNKKAVALCDFDVEGPSHVLNRSLHICLPLPKIRQRYMMETYVNFMGVDDTMYPDTLQLVEDQIKAHGSPEWLYCSAMQNGERLIEAKKWDYKRLKNNCYISGGAVFVRLDVYLMRHFRDIVFGMLDWDMWLQIGKDHTPVVLPEIVAYNEAVGNSSIRPKPGTLKSIIYCRIKYPIGRLHRTIYDWFL